MASERIRIAQYSAAARCLRSAGPLRAATAISRSITACSSARSCRRACALCTRFSASITSARLRISLAIFWYVSSVVRARPKSWSRVEASRSASSDLS